MGNPSRDNQVRTRAIMEPCCEDTLTVTSSSSGVSDSHAAAHLSTQNLWMPLPGSLGYQSAEGFSDGVVMKNGLFLESVEVSSTCASACRSFAWTCPMLGAPLSAFETPVSDAGNLIQSLDELES